MNLAMSIMESITGIVAVEGTVEKAVECTTVVVAVVDTVRDTMLVVGV